MFWSEEPEKIPVFRRVLRMTSLFTRKSPAITIKKASQKRTFQGFLPPPPFLGAEVVFLLGVLKTALFRDAIVV
jgi:hypothetical protein